MSAETIINSEEQSSIMLMNLMRKLNVTHFKETSIFGCYSAVHQTVAGSPIAVNMAQEGLRGVESCNCK
ncbi:MAG: hypothetical protein IPG08_10535 [Sphingobacteriaceae bacterium]|nr:hypothetical protein [Sphingobacteriaceae bacterium]